MSEQTPEPVEPDTNPDAEPEPEPIEGGDADTETDSEQVKPAGPSSEAVMQAADKENRRYIAKLDKILGDDPNRHECVYCNGLGVTWGEVEEDAPLVKATDAEPCATCNAYGQTITGSRNPQQATKPCVDCGGRGWMTVIVPPAPVAALPPYVPPSTQPIAGQWVEGRGFVPYGSTEPIPGSLGG